MRLLPHIALSLVVAIMAGTLVTQAFSAIIQTMEEQESLLLTRVRSF
ncbi:hypothetical protein [Azospirillum sp. SYSU D00513]|nr:hypothetical protein [Azospirillum sp. SYSU D00513]